MLAVLFLPSMVGKFQLSVPRVVGGGGSGLVVGKDYKWWVLRCSV